MKRSVLDSVLFKVMNIKINAFPYLPDEVKRKCEQDTQDIYDILIKEVEVNDVGGE